MKKKKKKKKKKNFFVFEFDPTTYEVAAAIES